MKRTVIIIAVVLLLLMFGGVWLFTGKPPVPVKRTGPPVDGFEIATNGPSATVYLNGKKAGATPFSIPYNDLAQYFDASASHPKGGGMTTIGEDGRACEYTSVKPVPGKVGTYRVYVYQADRDLGGSIDFAVRDSAGKALAFDGSAIRGLGRLVPTSPFDEFMIMIGLKRGTIVRAPAIQDDSGPVVIFQFGPAK